MSSDVKTFKQAIRPFSHRLGLAAIDDVCLLAGL